MASGMLVCSFRHGENPHRTARGGPVRYATLCSADPRHSGTIREKREPNRCDEDAPQLANDRAEPEARRALQWNVGTTIGEVRGSSAVTSGANRPGALPRLAIQAAEV